MHLVELQGVWVEDVLDWFNKHILDSGGDGAGAIVCSNPEEVADYFVTNWWGGKIPVWFSNDFKIEENGDRIINYHDMNENYIFTNKTDFNFGQCADYTFKIKGVCLSYKGNFKIFPV